MDPEPEAGRAAAMTIAIRTITTITPVVAPFYTTTTEEIEYSELSFGAVVASNFDMDRAPREDHNWRGIRYAGGVSYTIDLGDGGPVTEVYVVVSEVKDCGDLGRRAVWDD